jgi:hypothetical protein
MAPTAVSGVLEYRTQERIMAHHADYDDHRVAEDEEPDAVGALEQMGPSREVAATLEAMQRLCAGELDFVVAEGRVAGLATGVVLAVTPGGLVPLFTHVSADIAPVLIPATDAGGRPIDPTAARARLN